MSATIFLPAREPLFVRRAIGRVETLRAVYGVDGICQKCGCTDLNCRGCIERTGRPCSWANQERTLCSACVKS